MDEKNESEFLSTIQLAKMLNVSTKSIEKWRNQRIIPGACKIGRCWRFRKNEIEKKLLSGQLLNNRQ